MFVFLEASMCTSTMTRRPERTHSMRTPADTAVGGTGRISEADEELSVVHSDPLSCPPGHRDPHGLCSISSARTCCAGHRGKSRRCPQA